MRILLTNDDGISAPGLVALYEAIADLGTVQVIAPAKVQSAMSHAVTFHKPVTTRKHIQPDETGDPLFEGIAVEGRPADCVKLAIAHLLEEPADLVISGMNSGANVGINVIYSGTVGAAREAAFMGIPAIAISLHIGDWDHIRWQAAAEHARWAINQILTGPMQMHTVLNVNIPILDQGASPKGIRVVPISISPMVDEYENSPCPTGAEHWQCGDTMNFKDHHPGTDVEALFAGHITLTPLHFDLTQKEELYTWDHHLAPVEMSD